MPRYVSAIVAVNVHGNRSQHCAFAWMVIVALYVWGSVGWDLETNMVIRHYHGHLSAVYCLALHPTLDVLMTGGRDVSFIVYSIVALSVSRTGELAYMYLHAYMHTNMHPSILTRTYAYPNIHLYAIHKHMHPHTCRCIWAHTYICASTHTYTYICT